MINILYNTEIQEHYYNDSGHDILSDNECNQVKGSEGSGCYNSSTDTIKGFGYNKSVEFSEGGGVADGDGDGDGNNMEDNQVKVIKNKENYSYGEFNKSGNSNIIESLDCDNILLGLNGNDTIKSDKDTVKGKNTCVKEKQNEKNEKNGKKVSVDCGELKASLFSEQDDFDALFDGLDDEF